MDPAASPSRTPSWWSRNWKWFLPVGCLSCLMVLVGLIAIILFAATGMMKSSDAYRQALGRAGSDPRVVQRLGEPLEAGMLTSGGIQVNGPTGQADLAIPLSGPRGKGTLYLAATKSVGEWTFTRLVLEVDSTHERIDLLAEPGAGAP